MTITDIKTLKESQPFRKFSLRLVSGKDVAIDHPDFLFIPHVRKDLVFVENLNGDLNMVVLEGVESVFVGTQKPGGVL